VNTLLLLAGTKKGLFLLRSHDRVQWELSGPFHSGREINHAIYDARNGLIYAAVNDAWFGCEIARSEDLGKSWRSAGRNPAFESESGYKLERIWHVEPGSPSEPKLLYAGVAPAALFWQSGCGRNVVRGHLADKPPQPLSLGAWSWWALSSFDRH
jgi:hypothetical protein